MGPLSGAAGRKPDACASVHEETFSGNVEASTSRSSWGVDTEMRTRRSILTPGHCHGQMISAHRPSIEETPACNYQQRRVSRDNLSSRVQCNTDRKMNWTLGFSFMFLALHLGMVDGNAGRLLTHIRAPSAMASARPQNYRSSGSSPSTLFESDTICQSYKDLCPPLHRRSKSVGSDGLRLRAQADGLRLRHAATPVCKEAVLVLDLDKTSIFGNDGNDFGISLQWMEKPDKIVQDLYKLLVSPCVRPAFEDLKARAGKVDVVIYTRRPQVLKYQSCFRECVIPIQYQSDWHHDGQLYLPPSIRNSDEVMKTYCGPELLEDEVNDVKKSLERLIAARDALTETLGLEVNPTVVVTATDKCVEETVKHLDLQGTNAVLFDDNVALQYDPKTIVVDSFEALPELRRRELLFFMEEHLPAAQLDEELVEYLEGARAEEKALVWDATKGAYQWRVPVASTPIKPWRLPMLKSDASPWERASDSGFGMPPWTKSPLASISAGAKAKPTLIGPTERPMSSKSNACLSPVTPELSDSPGGNARVDLRAVAERAAKLREEQAIGVGIY